MVHESLTDDELTPALSIIVRMVEVTGGDYVNAIILHLRRYHDLALEIDGNVGTVVTISDDELSCSASSEHFLLLTSQMMTPLQHSSSSQQHRFLFAH